MKTKMNRAQRGQRKTFFTIEAKKKLFELSSAKLSVLSIGLLLAVFCTIGMSFTPAEEGDNVGNPNDSTYVTGPRRSHYYQSGCYGDTNHYEKDYAKATASTAGNGHVTIVSTSGGGLVTNPASYANGTILTSGSNSEASVSISWNCNHKETSKGEVTATAAMHTRKFTIEAFPDEDYYFKGWSTSTSENDIFEKANSYTFDQTIDDWDKNNGSHESETKALTTTYYAIFKPEVMATITFAVPEHGSYTFSTEDVSATTVSSSTGEKQLTTKKAVTLTATPVSGYKFFGWYKSSDSPANYLGYTSPLTLGFEEDATIYAKFIKSDAALFQVKGDPSVTYYDLNVACTAAKSSTSKVVVPTANGTVAAGNYTIPSGVTLLVPFDDAYTLRTTDPTHTYAVPGTPSLYRKLILGSNVQIIVNGSISVSSTSQGNIPYGGCVYGKYGQIDMQSGSTITLNNGANLYCWGYITGSGEITAKSGSKVYEDFQIACWRGGNAASSMNSNSKKVFPLAQYYIQNIEAKLHLQAGASEYVWTSVSALSAAQKPNSAIPLVGASSGLFQISSGTLTKWFNATDDRQMYEMNGDMALGSISMKVYITISSADYVLPLTNNMDITVKSGTMTCNQKIALLPGAKITIEEGANVSFGANSELYVYDKDEWPNDGASAFNYNNVSFKKVNYTATKITNARTYANMNDAIMDINGTFTTASGNFYTTSGKANIYSSNGTGKVIFQAAPASKTPAAGSGTYTYQATQSGSTISYTSIPITPAQLHNADGSYLATAGTAANTTIQYANGHWGWVGTWKNEDGSVIKNANTCTEALLSGKAPDNPTKAATVKYTYPFKEWVVDEDNSNRANQELVYIPTFDQTINKYTITWEDGDGNTLKTEEVDYDATPSYSDTPTKAATEQYTYTFAGWTPTVSPVTGDATYTAQFNSTLRTYTVTWENEDGTILEIDENVPYGATPEYNGATPTKEATAQYTYTFADWTPTISPVTGDVTYTATFTETVNTFTVTWKNSNGTVLETDNNVPYGTTPTYDGATPVSPSDDYAYTFPFAGWTPTISPVTGDVTYTATYGEKEFKTYHVKWVNWNGEELYSATKNYGWAKPDEYEGTTPTRPTAAGIMYRFTGWSAPDYDVEKCNATITAQYEEVKVLDIPEEETISVNTTVETTIVHVSGRLTVSSGTLTTDDLILEATPGTSGEITGTVVATKAYFDFSQDGGFKARTWYAVAVPWQVEVPAYAKGGVYTTNDGDSYTQQQLGSTFDLIYYDGMLRASSGHSDACWKYVEDDGATEIMQPGKAYMIYLASDAKTIRFERKEGAGLLNTTLSVTEYASAKGRDASWNGIANPATFHAYINPNAGNYDDTENAGQVYDGDSRSYRVINLSAQNLVVGQPVFVQAKETQPAVTAYSAHDDAYRAAPRRAKADNDILRLEVSLSANEGTHADRIIIRADEEKEADAYTVGQDLVKMSASDIVPQMWVDRYDSRLCINTVAPVNGTAIYPLSLFAPSADEYTISTNATAEDNVTLYLTFDGRPVWNLTYSPYVTSLERGTTQHYGLMLVRSKAPEVATGVETITNDELQITKILLDGQVYILRGGELYSITGQSIK